MALTTPVLLVGAGHMGGALIEGWLRAETLMASELIIIDPSPGEAARAAIADGAIGEPEAADLERARIAVLAVRPQTWRGVGEALAPRLAAGAVVVSIMAGVRAADIETVLPGRPVARAMPTMSSAMLQGATSLWSADARALACARALFEPLGVVVALASEDQLHAATAACGSASGYFFAMVEALAAAGETAGLSAPAARELSRQALIGAAAMLEASGEEASTLRARIASPGGTTEAGLAALTGGGALHELVNRTVAAAAARSRQLGGEA